MFGNAIISCGGVIPHIHPTLMPTNKKGGKDGKDGKDTTGSKPKDSQEF